MSNKNKTPPTGKDRLTPKQEKFCLKYSECGNASEAYRHAYQAGKMKPESINRMAFALLADLKITSRVEELRRVNQQLSEVKRADILARLKSYFNFDIRKILTVKDGMVTVKDSDLWDAEAAQAVEAVEVGNVNRYSEQQHMPRERGKKRSRKLTADAVLLPLLPL